MTMNLYYICPKSVWEGVHATHGLRMYDLMAGSSYVEIEDGHILLSTSFKNEFRQSLWHEHREVARLAHPTMEPGTPIAHLHKHPQYAHKNFKPHHFDKLRAAFGIDETHTVWDLHNRLKDKYPGLRLNAY